jgi:hypothetical protein
MKKYSRFLFLLALLPVILNGQVSIYDIQYTEVPGYEGTYPSPMVGDYVNTGGIVTAIGFNGVNYFISSSNGGPWSGIYIYDDNYAPAIGDSILIHGLVYEYNGLTEIMEISSFEIVSSANPLPPPAAISTAAAFSEEAYESVFIELSHLTVTQTYDEWNEWQVDDGNGPCIMSDGIFSLQGMNFPLISGYRFNSIKGVITYHYDNFRVHPRSINDLVSESNANIFSVNKFINYNLNEIEVLLNLTLLGQTKQIKQLNSYSFVLQYNPDDLEYTGFCQIGTISANGTISDQSTSGIVYLSFSGNFTFSGVDDLIKLNFLPLISGETELEFSSAFLDGTEVDYLSSGQIFVNSASEPIGDTLTTIQRPLVNIPSIVVPGDELDIMCIAPESTTGWQSELILGDETIDLEVTQSYYNNDLQRWYLKALIPQPEIFELYDLKVTASEEIEDITWDAVKIIPEWKNSYYFIHITDTHLPTHYYWDDPLYEGDSSEMEDLREVIEDINLINPEFVLLTGDYINEGELEGFQNRRYYTKAQRMLKEFEVPVYLVSGNHDIGGWPETPMPQGTARNDWWRFFGWPWLIDPPVNEPFYTQDYSFDYGNVHYIGLESYDNYDGYLYYIYGNTSFIPLQLIWLDNDLQNSTGSESRVLFYHYDFANQINLSSLGVDMALWGHIHHNNGSIYSYPYNLATNNVCDENRAYRVIRVNNGVLQPKNTVEAGVNGGKVNINFSPANNGLNDSVSAVIYNDHGLVFENGMLKFIMPKGEFGYLVNNGILQQVDKSGQFAVCYVKVNIPANGTTTVTIKVDDRNSVKPVIENSPVIVYQNYPNPFQSETTIRFWLDKPEFINLEIFDMSGKLVRTLINEEKTTGSHSVIWNGKDDNGESLSGRVYLYKFQAGTGYIVKKRMIKI